MRIIKKILKVLGIIIGGFILLIIAGIFSMYVISFFMDAKRIVQNPVYPPGKSQTFISNFFNASGQNVRTDTLFLDIIDERFFIRLNKMRWTLKTEGETFEENSGLIEDLEEVSINPPRFDDYHNFTTFSALPTIQWPATIDKKWKIFTIHGFDTRPGSGLTMITSYHIADVDTLSINPVVRELTLLGKGESGYGLFDSEMIFHEEIGFTKLAYTKANKEKLIIELIR